MSIPAMQASASKPQANTLTGWNPEDERSWDPKLAWRTLIISTYSLILAFCVWFLVSAIAPKLNSIGFDLSKSQLYWLTSMPGLAAGIIRLIYMFLPPIIGTRKLVGWSSLLYLIPMLGWFFAIQNPSTSFGVLLVLAFICGIGGGTFSGYMPSTGYFFPKRLQGTALGLQAGIGNLGMSLIQLVGPMLMGFGLFGMTWLAPNHTKTGGHLWVYNATIFFIPWMIVAAILAFTMLRDVPVTANFRQQISIFSNPDTWIMTLMYVMTFGLFSGISAQFGLLINNTYGSASIFKNLPGIPVGASYAFLGPLIASVVRVIWGPLCDRLGGAIWTFVSGIGLAITLGIAALFLNPHSLSQWPGFLWTMLIMFVFAGIGNAGTFKQMPMIMPKTQAGGAIGFTAAIAAFGPFFVGVALSAMSSAGFFWICAAYSVLCAVICWIRYARPHAPFPG